MLKTLVTANVRKSNLIIDGADMKWSVTGIISAVNVGTVVDQLLKKLHPANLTYLPAVKSTTELDRN